MRRRLIIGTIIGVAAIVAVVAVVNTGANEPEYQGRSLTQWVAYSAQPMDSADMQRLREIERERAIRNMGAKALPRLMQMWRSTNRFVPPAPWRQRWETNLSGTVFATWLNWVSYGKGKELPPFDQIESAISSLDTNVTALAIPELTAMSLDANDTKNQLRVLQLGHCFGLPVVPLLLSVATNKDAPYQNRSSALTSLAKVKEISMARSTVEPAMERCTHESDEWIEISASRVVLKCVEDDPKEVTHLATNWIWGDYHPGLKFASTHALWRKGDQDSLPFVLSNCLDHPQENVRVLSSNLLLHFAPEMLKGRRAKE